MSGENVSIEVEKLMDIGRKFTPYSKVNKNQEVKRLTAKF